MADDQTPPVDIKTKRPLSEAQLAARRKGTEAAKRRNNKPASGIPASGIMAGGHPPSGPGWGGEANGVAPAFSEDYQPARPTDKSTRGLSDETVSAQMRDVLYTVAQTSEFEMARIAAASKLLDRIEGTPIARSISYRADEVAKLTDDELRSELARLGRTGTDPQA